MRAYGRFMSAAAALVLGGVAGRAWAGDPDGRGPARLAELLREHERACAESRDVSKLEVEIDGVAGQKDAVFSRLYWRRDRAEAGRVAAASGRPIVTLRLLGDLSCDRSCANSRFFRTALYANERVAALLRDRAVLHWESVRPVPTITIDMGDGRRLERTITGNSAHYVLTPQGEVVDVLPGLYGPGAFRAALEQALEVATRAGALAAPADRAAVLRSYQAMTAKRLEDQRAAALRPGEQRRALEATVGAGGRGGAPAFPTAREATFRAEGKMMVEMPMLERMGYDGPSAPVDGAAWREVAERPGVLALARLDARSRALMERKMRPGTTPEERDAIARRFEARMARDTVENDLALRPRALRHLAGAEAPVPIDDLNRWVYAELFLTPEEDPWLGLDAAGEYAALADDGVVLD